MGQEPTITEAAVRRLARPQSFDRGENYYEQDRVIDVVRRGETLQAEVEGSQYEPYTVRIEFDETGVVDTHCSCPYDHGGICKHRVAVLLTYLRDPDTVTQRPPVPELLAGLDREALYELLLSLLEDHPDLTEWIERAVETEAVETVDGSGANKDPTRQTAPDPDTVRRHVNSIIHPSEPPNRSPQDPYAAVESRVDDLRDLLAEARAFLEAGEGEAALAFLDAMAEELMGEEWLALSYDDSTAIFEFLDELSAAFTEALLVADLSEADREEWADRLADWTDELSGYTRRPPFQAAATAAEHGWDSERVQAALQGTVDEEEFWDGERPWYADELLTAQLNILEREDRTEEYLNLAQTAGQPVQYATKLVELDCHEEAVEYALNTLSTPDEALAVAKTFREDDRPETAIRVARHGLSLNGTRNVELADWLRDLASAHGDEETAREAAIAAFRADPTLATYQAAEEVAGDEWSTIREELLDHLQQRSPGRDTAREHAEIFLYEDMIDEAITIADESGHYIVVEPVVEAVWEERPGWSIKACKEQAEPIIEEGQSQRYRHAVDWLETAGKAAEVAGELDEWRAYVENLRDEHYQKYKLRPMLEELLEEFEGR